MIYSVSVDDLILFGEVASANIRPGTLADSIVFVDTVSSNYHYAVSSDYLALIEGAGVNTILALSVGDSLVFSDTTTPRTILVSTSDFLILQDVLDRPTAGLILDSFVLSDVAVMSLSHPAGPDLLVFSDTMSSRVISVRGLTETLSLSDSFSSVLLNELAPDVTVGYVHSGELYKIHLVDVSEDIELDSFDFNDTETTRYKRINRNTRGYTPIITGIAGWPPFKTKKVTFTYLTELEVNRIRAFYRRNVGIPVTLHDMYGVDRAVILQNPEFESAQVGRENCSISMDFYVL